MSAPAPRVRVFDRDRLLAHPAASITAAGGHRDPATLARGFDETAGTDAGEDDTLPTPDYLLLVAIGHAGRKVGAGLYSLCRVAGSVLAVRLLPERWRGWWRSIPVRACHLAGRSGTSGNRPVQPNGRCAVQGGVGATAGRSRVRLGRRRVRMMPPPGSSSERGIDE